MNSKKNILTDIQKSDFARFFIILFFAFLLKYMIYGFHYYPALDDYIQYGGYPLYHNPSFVLFDIGTICSRPLSAILDIFFWGSLWKMPIVMLIFSSFFHFFSCVILYKTATENEIALSPLFAVLFLFFPLSSEGAYWISASSRITVGIFFVSTTLYMLTKYIKSEKIIYFLCFFIFALCSFALYESCAVLCFMACIFLLIKNRDIKRALLPIVSLCVLLCSLVLYTKFMQNLGMIGSRASESSFLLIFTQAGDFLSQLAEILTTGFAKITFNGFDQGLLLLFSKGIWGIFYLALIFAVCIIFGKFTAGHNEKTANKKNAILQVIAGFVLFIAPFAPNMISNPVWITYRTMFIPLIGIYLVLDVLFSKIKIKAIQTVILTSLMFIFIVSGINEYDTYKRNFELESALITKVCEQLPEEVKNGSQNAAILLDELPCVSQVSFYKDHVKSVFYTDWALTGAVREHLDNMNIKKVTPVYPDMTFDYSDCFVVDMRK